MIAFKKALNDNIKNYILTAVKDELVTLGCGETEAQKIVTEFIDNPESREDIIDQWELGSIRLCEHCGQPMHEGYLYSDSEPYCSESCVKEEKKWDDDVFNSYIEDAEDDDALIYWTSWEG